MTSQFPYLKIKMLLYINVNGNGKHYLLISIQQIR